MPGQSVFDVDLKKTSDAMRDTAGGLPCELRPRQVHNIDLLRFCWTLPQGLQCTKTSVIASRYIYEWPLNVAKLELAGLPLLVLVTRLHEHCDEQSPGAQAGALLVVVT